MKDCLKFIRQSFFHCLISMLLSKSESMWKRMPKLLIIDIDAGSCKGNDKIEELRTIRFAWK